MADEAVTLRRRVEDVSRPLLVRLTGMPKATMPLGTAALLAIGVFAPTPVALPALVLILAFVGWITYLAWPVVPLSGRLMRIFMLGLVVVLVWLRVASP